MANPYYKPGAERPEKVHALFSRIAPKYDLMNDLQSFGLHRYWKKQVVKLAAPIPGERALDVCCGTGDLALALAARGAEVTGLDFTNEMLQIALGRSRSSPSGPRFLRGNAEDLPFADGSFEIVTIGYGLRNLADWKRGLAEMQRVSKPGGRVFVLDFGKPENALWQKLYFGYLRLFVPCLGKVFCGSAAAYAYILESLTHYPAQEGVATEMNRLGMVNTRLVRFLGGVMTINYGEKA